MSEDKKWTVYVHTVPSGKKYVGITSRNPVDRWNNGNGYQGQMFGKAVKKYGWANIVHEIVSNEQTHDEAVELEKKQIAEYQTTDSRYGYNLTYGGEGCKASEQTKKLMSKNRQGKNAHGFGHPMPDSAKKAVAQKLTGVQRSAESKEKMSKRKRKCVWQYTLNGEYVDTYKSVTEAADKINGNRGNIAACCRHVVRQANGYFWSYYPIDDPEIIKGHTTGENPLPVIRSRNYSLVIQTDHNGTILKYFDSIKEAAKTCGYTEQQISHCLQNPNAVSGPYKWRYQTDGKTESCLHD